MFMKPALTYLLSLLVVLATFQSQAYAVPVQKGQALQPASSVSPMDQPMDMAHCHTNREMGAELSQHSVVETAVVADANTSAQMACCDEDCSMDNCVASLLFVSGYSLTTTVERSIAPLRICPSASPQRLGKNLFKPPIA